MAIERPDPYPAQWFVGSDHAEPSSTSRPLPIAARQPQPDQRSADARHPGHAAQGVLVAALSGLVLWLGIIGTAFVIRSALAG